MPYVSVFMFQVIILLILLVMRKRIALVSCVHITLTCLCNIQCTAIFRAVKITFFR